MDIINAKQAKEFANRKRQNTVEAVLTDIKQSAIKGDYNLTISTYLDNIVLSSLEKLGFVVKTLPSIAQQKNGDYHVISWENA